MMNDDKPYILGTDNEEIKRLELQHKYGFLKQRPDGSQQTFQKIILF